MEYKRKEEIERNLPTGHGRCYQDWGSGARSKPDAKPLRPLLRAWVEVGETGSILGRGVSVVVRVLLCVDGG